MGLRGVQQSHVGYSPTQACPVTCPLLSLTACGEVAAGLRVEAGSLADCRSEHREALLDSLFPSPLENLSFRSFCLLFKKTFHFVLEYSGITVL